MQEPEAILTETQVRAALRKEIQENGRGLLHEFLRLLSTTVFPATPKILTPESGTSVFILLGDLYIWMKTNRGDKPYRLTAVDLTNAGNVIPHQDLPAPGAGGPPVYFSAYIPRMYLVSGHDYRIRIEVRPDVASADDETDTSYVTLL